MEHGEQLALFGPSVSNITADDTLLEQALAADEADREAILALWSMTAAAWEVGNDSY